MKKWNNITICFCLLLFGLWGCMDDMGNYDYDFERVPEIVLDSAMLAEVTTTLNYAPWNVGDRIQIPLELDYPYPENLVYYWLIMDSPYQAETVGNSEVYPPADTICRTLDFDYTVTLEAGKSYQLWLKIQDTVNDISGVFQILYRISVPEAGEIGGVYCLQEKDGRLDIDVFGTPVCLIYSYGGSNNFHVEDYWSTVHADMPLQGNEPRIYFSSTGQWFYIFTEEEGYRCSPANLVVMDTWEEMFYDAPVYNPQAFVNMNTCDFLINDGKLHTLYHDGGDRKFLTAVGGDYTLAPFLATNTYVSYGSVTEGAIQAYQVVYDEQRHAFRPFYNRGASLGNFNASISSVFDVNNMQGELLYTTTVNGGETMAVMRRNDGSYWLDIASFYNVVDNGNLARRSVSLAGCQGIDQASCFIAGNMGAALFYGAGNTLYSFSYTTGQTSANVLWTGEPGDEITCMEMLPSGGFPSGGLVLWAAVWNETAQEGKVVEIEFDPATGLVNNQWGPMFGGQETPLVYDGFGKIISMVAPLMY